MPKHWTSSAKVWSMKVSVEEHVEFAGASSARLASRVSEVTLNGMFLSPSAVSLMPLDHVPGGRRRTSPGALAGRASDEEDASLLTFRNVFLQRNVRLPDSLNWNSANLSVTNCSVMCSITW